MKFTCTVQINLPINKTVELWEDPANLDKWQDGFISFEHISGTPGKPGAKSRMRYIMNKRDMELIETILVNNLPTEMSATYEHIHMVNNMTNRFTKLGDNLTQWDADIEYTKFNSFIPKIMAWLMPGMLKNRPKNG